MAEFATVGYEGMLGVPVFLGASRAAHRAFCQVPGEVLRIPTEKFRRQASGGRLREIMQLYTQALFTQVSQHASCKLTHLVEQRTVKWLVMSHDRAGTDTFPLTQEFLAQMVGARRASINQAMGMLRDAGLVDYVRGVLTIKDRPALAKRSCECYGVINGEFERLLGVKFGR